VRAGAKLSTGRLFDHTDLIFKSTSSQPAVGWWQVVNRLAVWPYPFNFQEYKKLARCSLVTSCQLAGCLTDKLSTGRLFHQTMLFLEKKWKVQEVGHAVGSWRQVASQPSSCGLLTSCHSAGCLTKPNYIWKFFKFKKSASGGLVTSCQAAGQLQDVDKLSTRWLFDQETFIYFNNEECSRPDSCKLVAAGQVSIFKWQHVTFNIFWPAIESSQEPLSKK